MAIIVNIAGEKSAMSEADDNFDDRLKHSLNTRLSLQHCKEFCIADLK